ncbi:phage portal protein [Alicyclobacillus acidoterrestris]|nr:phage portal protein [Alicyclobacillus acidoterrestris]
MNLGLPEVIISFQTAAQTAVQRSQQGVVALILRDDTVTTFTTKTYNTIDDVAKTDWTDTNYNLISKTFLGTPSKVIVVRGGTTDTDYTQQLTTLATMRWNYMAIPGIASDDVSAVSTWLIGQRAAPNSRTFKAVLPNSPSDNEGIINFATEGIVVEDTTYTASQYTGRIAGILAGLPQTRSATYYVLSEVDSITPSADPDSDVDAGKLILINDGEKVKIARGVNSLVTLTGKSADWQKIKIIDGHDLVQDDIRNTFNDEYVGKVNNDYDNQAIFIAAVNQYWGYSARSKCDKYRRRQHRSPASSMARRRHGYEQLERPAG